MTIAQAAECHAGGWSDSEIQSFTSRVVRFMRAGISVTDADDLAERLTLRDREADDRRSCAECTHGRAARCPDGAPLPGGVLHRCPRYAP